VFLKKNTLLVTKIFKNHIIFKNTFLTDIVVYDNPGKVNRFTIIILTQSVHFNTRTELIFKTDETKPINSLYPLYKGASWLEREI